jgi:DNA-binding Lrp family transcriptional regulator
MSFKIRDFRNKRFFQVDDEYLNGYAKLCGIHATGVYFSLCRHANKEQTCFPSKKLIARELSISERTVYTAIKKLEEWDIIKIESQGRKDNGSFKNLIYILLDKSQWKDKPSANCAVGKKQQPPSASGAKPVGTSCRRSKHIEVNTYKEIADKSAGQKINELLKEFEEVNPTINYGNKTQRKVLEDMVNKWGYEKTLNTIKASNKIQCKKYAPTITTPIQLKNKLGELLVYYKKETNNQPKTISL